MEEGKRRREKGEREGKGERGSEGRKGARHPKIFWPKTAPVTLLVLGAFAIGRFCALPSLTIYTCISFVRNVRLSTSRDRINNTCFARITWTVRASATENRDSLTLFLQ